jgi:hypothetical protein
VLAYAFVSSPLAKVVAVVAPVMVASPDEFTTIADASVLAAARFRPAGRPLPLDPPVPP